MESNHDQINETRIQAVIQDSINYKSRYLDFAKKYPELSSIYGNHLDELFTALSAEAAAIADLAQFGRGKVEDAEEVLNYGYKFIELIADNEELRIKESKVERKFSEEWDKAVAESNSSPSNLSPQFFYVKKLVDDSEKNTN